MFGLGIASLFFTGLSVVQQIGASKDAKRIAAEQKKQGQAERALGEMRSRKAKVEELRKGRIARAQIVSAAETSGVAGSSAAVGGAGAVQTQTAAGIGFLGAVEETSKKLFESQQRISDISRQQSQKLAFASITGTLGQTFRPAVKGLFK